MAALDISSPEGALQHAIMARLAASGRLIALFGERAAQKILDEVPNDRDGERAPYLCLGPLISIDAPAGCGATYEIRLRLFAASVDFGRIEAWNIIHAARAALRDADLALAAPFRCQSFVIAAAGDAAEPERVKSAFLDIVATVTESTL